MTHGGAPLRARFWTRQEFVMDRVVLELRQWLERHGLPADGVELRVVMPEGRDAYEARSISQAELKPYPVAGHLTKIRGDIQLHGVDVTFERRQL